MYNYTKGNDSYIFNIMNQNDNLCFIYYIILIKYLCEYNTLKPKVNPNEINLFIPYLPLINYPDIIFNKITKRILRNISQMEMLMKVSEMVNIQEIISISVKSLR